MKTIKDYNIPEVIDRLLHSCFDFRLENNKLIIKSYPHREESSSVLGFHYWGNQEEYCYELTDVEIQDIIADAFAAYNEYLQQYIEKTSKDFCSSLSM